jgi:hypothetical protein
MARREEPTVTLSRLDATGEMIVERLAPQVWQALLALPLVWVPDQKRECYLAAGGPCCVTSDDARALAHALHHYRFNRKVSPQTARDASLWFGGRDAPLLARLEEFCSHGDFTVGRI